MHELLYTSAPATLDGPGYGTVGKTKNFPKRVEKFIRQNLNQYDFSAGSKTEQTAVFSYNRFDAGGEVWHILSRVGFGGYDYTQRAVFLAHHVAISTAELPFGNAAALMLDPDLLHDCWNGQVGLLSIRSVPSLRPYDPHCKTWEALAGDPRWAQVWVDRWEKRRGVPQFLIVPDVGMMLPLCAEAHTILKPGAESPMFLTNLTSARSGVQWDWIGLTAGSNMLEEIRSRFPDRVLDLCRPLGKVAGPPRRPAAARTPSAPPKAPSTASLPELVARPLDPWEQMIETDLVERTARVHQEASVVLRPPPPPPAAKSSQWMWAGLATFLVAGVSSGLWHLATSSATAPAVTQPADGPGADPGKETAVVATPPPVQQEPTIPVQPPTNAEPMPAIKPPATEGTGVGQAPPPSGNPPIQNLPSRDAEPSKSKKGPIVRFADPGWRAGIENSESNQPVDVLRFKEHVLPSDWHFALRTPPLVGLDAKDVGETIDSGRMLKIALIKEGEGASAQFRFNGDHLQCSCEGTPAARKEILDRLQFAVLEVGAAHEPALRVAFTPQLSALPIEGDWVTQDKDNAGAFFSAADRFGLAPMLKLRIKRFSLSIAEANQGWNWKDPKSSSNTIRMRTSEGEYRVDVTAKIDEEKTQTIRRSVRLKQSEIDKTDHAAHDGSARDEPSGENANPEPTKGSNKKPAANAKKPSAPSATNESDRDLLDRVLRRFGELHGAIMLETDGEELELVRFEPQKPSK